MATISLAGIELVTNTTPELYLANVVIVSGEVLYLDSNEDANLAQNDDAANDEIAVVALQAASVGNYVVGIPTGATIQVTNTLVVGDVYVLAATAGDVMLASDLLSTQFLSVFGTVSATNQILLSFDNTGSQKA